MNPDPNQPVSPSLTPTGSASPERVLDSAIPTARVELPPQMSRKPKSGWGVLFSTRIWILTALCVLVALVLTLSAFRAQGPTILVRFQEGHGLKPGDSLRFHGIEVGRIVSVTLNSQFETRKDPLEVTIVLEPRAAGLAREGARFWIERPRLGLGRVSGVETAFGAKFVGVLPGPAGNPPQTQFDGLETPPNLADSPGMEIVIAFRDGHGLAVGDTVRFRGNTVGEVVALDWETNLNGLRVKARLLDGALPLARSGSQFWIERPRVSAMEVKGLDTLVGGRFIGLIPGPAEGEPAREFLGLEQPPQGERPEGALEILVEGSQRLGIEAGVPVTYRGVPVGQVASVGLASDAVNVEARVWILPAYKSLVRDNTQFWNSSGVDFSLGLTGIRFRADTFSTVAMGGLAFATPVVPGKPVATGHRFPFASKNEPEWLNWAPRLPVGNALLPEGKTLPVPVRATLRWSEKSLAINWSQEKSGWLLPLADGTLLGPADLFTPPANASPDRPVVLEFLGNRLPVKPEWVTGHGLIATYKLETQAGPDAWPMDRLRTPRGLEDGLVVSDSFESAFLLASQRLSLENDFWGVAASVPLDRDRHGACIVSPKDGKLIGILLMEKGKGRVATWK